VSDPTKAPAPNASRGAAGVSARGSFGLVLRLAASLVVAGLFAWALAPYIDAIPADARVDPLAMIAFGLLLLLYLFARGARWIFLLRPLAPVPLRVALSVGLAGSMWIALLPFRLGELARPLLLAKTTPIDMRRGLGVVALERVVDGLMIGLFFFVTLRGHSEAELGNLYRATVGVMAAFVAALAALLVMARWPRAAGEILRATVGRVSPRAAAWAADLSHGIAEGMAALPRGGPLLWFSIATIGYWAVNAAAMWVLARGCDLPLSPPEMVAVMAVMNVALLVPGGPAQLGIFQGGVALGLSLFLPADLVHDRGSTFVFWLYAGQLVAITIAGLVAQRRLGIDARSILVPSRAVSSSATSTEAPR
jgi:hypothetical protein